MMGRTHATSGAVLALLAVPPANWLPALAHWQPLAGTSVAVCAVAAAGGAMLPDLDHEDATISHALGPLTRAVARVVGAASGGHRNGTHSLLGVAMITGLSALISAAGNVALGLWLAFLFAVGAAALRLRMSRVTIWHTLVCLAGGFALMHTSLVDDVPIAAVTLGVFIGATAHVIGDMANKEGCPLLWPVSRTRHRYAGLSTGHLVERLVVGPVLFVLMVFLIAHQYRIAVQP